MVRMNTHVITWMKCSVSGTRNMTLFGFIPSNTGKKKTFENKHYHVFLNCIQGRNPTFDAKAVNLGLSHTLSAEEIQHLKDRLHC